MNDFDSLPTDPSLFQPSLTQLRAFSAVATLNSISRAADELHRTQSAVTQAIKRLETDLGVPLFIRTNSGSYPTDAGRILFRRAEACFSAIEAALRRIMPGDQRVPAMARRITLAQILSLKSVHEHGSFMQAARHAKVSLTSLQRSARALESQLHREIFVSTAYGVKTNDAGAMLSGDLYRAIRELESAGEEIRFQQGSLRGQLLIGSLLLAGNPFLAVGIDSFASTYPETHLKLTHGSYDELLGKLRSGSIDFLIGLLKNPPPTDDVVEEKLGLDHYVLAVRKAHPLAGKSGVTIEDLMAYEWVAARPSSQRWRVFETLFQGRSMPRHSVETHSLLTVLVLLSGRDRIALMTSSELALDQRLGCQLAQLDFKVDEPPAQIGVTTRANWEPTPLQRTFLESMRI